MSQVSRLARYTAACPWQLPRPVADLSAKTCGLSRKLFYFFPKENRLKSARLRRSGCPTAAPEAARRAHSWRWARRRSPRPKWPGSWTVSHAARRRADSQPERLVRSERSAGPHSRSEAGSTPLPNPSGLMTNTGRDGRTHSPALARRCVQGA